MAIEGIPDGYEPARFDYAVDGEVYMKGNGEFTVHVGARPTQVKRLIIRKIEKPKRYRPFANAAEFEPHREKWLKHLNEPDKRFRLGDYNDSGVWAMNRMFYEYTHLFESGTLFDDGTPFGVEVVE